MPIRTTLLLMLFAGAAQAAEHGGEAHAAGIPTHTVFWQCFNLFFVVLILYFIGRKSLPEIFRQRQAGYVASAKKADEAKLEAEKQFLDIQHKLEHLTGTYEESMSRAQAEAADLRKQLIAEAQEQARRVKDEAAVTVKIEAQKAQRELHDSFVKESIGMARAALTKDIASNDHQRLQTDFTKNISKNMEAVRP